MSLMDSFKSVFSSKKNISKIDPLESMAALGTPTVILRNSEGKIMSAYESSNLVLDSGRNALVRMLSGEYSSRIRLIEVGTGGVTEGDPWTPIPPASSDPGIIGPLAPVVQKDISGFEYDAGYNPDKVYFSVIFESYEVDAIVSEAVLKFEDGLPYARYTFPAAYLKADKGYSLEIIWASKFASR